MFEFDNTKLTNLDSVNRKPTIENEHSKKNKFMIQ